MCSTVYFKTCIICTVFSPRIINISKSKSLDLGDYVLITALSVSSDAISCLVKTLSEITLSVSIDMLSLVGFPRPTLLSLQPKINIKESITNVLSIILFIVFKYFDHFIALFFLYKIRWYYYDIIQAPYSTPILLDQCQMEAMEYHHHFHY